METHRITEKEIEGMKPLAVGYKIFKPDWKANNGYCYADENGEVLNSIHTVEGNISECRWGLHFSKKPQDCFNFYESVQWNRFAKVEAYGECFDSDNGDKSVAKTIKIVKTYTFNEFIGLIQQSLQSNGVNESYGVNCSSGVNRSDGVNWSDGVNESFGVNRSDGVNRSYGVNRSNGVNNSNGVNWSYGVNESFGVNRSNGVNNSSGVNRSDGVNKSYGVNCSSGVNNSNGVNWSYGITECDGISYSIFCYKKSGKLYVFNKKTTQERYNEIMLKIRTFGWYPKFNNAEELKGNREWFETNIPDIVSVPNEVAWSFMPKDMKGYLQSLPEYSEKVFKKVTGKIDE